MKPGSTMTQGLGFAGFTSGSGAGNPTITGAASPSIYGGYGFLAPYSGTLSKVQFRCGGIAASDVRASIYTDDGTGRPSTMVAGSETAGQAIVTNAINTFTFPAGVTLTAGVRYHCVVKSYTVGENPYVYYTVMSNKVAGNSVPCWSSSGYTGSAWNTPSYYRIGGFYTMASGEQFGCCYFSNTNKTFQSSGSILFGTRFVTPDLWFETNLASLGIYKTGTPVGTITLRLYVNGHLTAESAPVNMALILTSAYFLSLCLPTVRIPPKSVCMLVCSGGGYDGTNFIRTNQIIKSLNGSGGDLPLNSTYVESTDNGVTWNETTDRAVPFWLQGSFSKDSDFPPDQVNRRTFRR